MNKEKKELLTDKINQYTKQDVMVAFSGGADSSLLLKLVCDAASRNKTQVYAVTVQTMLHPKSDMAVAARVAKETGAVHKILKIDELLETGIEKNPKDRCYRCKKGIFLKIQSLAKELDISVILEGTNEDDLHQYRPGIRALKELGIISPLAECGVHKSEIRELAKELGISVAERPASPCLATRLPYGTRITYDILDKIDAGEAYIRSLGCYNVRLRVHGDMARIEVDSEDIWKLTDQREAVVRYLKTLGFLYCTVDLEGFRSGSMDIGLEADKDMVRTIV